MGDDPNELTAAKTFIGGRVLTVRYSADPQRYMPLCPSCHWHFDRGGE